MSMLSHSVAARPVASGEEWVSDKSYLMGIGARYSNDSLVYEKTMLNDWFRNRFGKTHS